MERQGRVFAAFALVFCFAVITLIVALANVSVAPRPATPIQSRSGAQALVPDPASLLWPGSFQPTAGGSQFSIPFVAVGRKYFAQVTSTGFVVSSGGPSDRPMQLMFVGARSAVAQAADALSAPLRLFRNRSGSKAAIPVSRYHTVGFANSYPGIDARYKESGGDLELDFIVHPGADPESIDLRAANGTELAQDRKTGDIVASRGRDRYRIRRAVAYQVLGTQRVDISLTMQTRGADIKFIVGDYNRQLPLIIDPLVAVYSTFVGTNTDAGYDNLTSIATDSQGNVYLGGVTEFDFRIPTEVNGFPTTPASLAPQNPLTDPAGGPCVQQCGYVLKLDAQQHVVYGALIYGENVNSIAVDSTGSAYATGGTSSGNLDLALTTGTFSDGASGSSFLFRLAPDGSKFVFNASFNADTASAVAVDPLGNAYVVGYVRLVHPPTTPGSLKPNYQDPGNGMSNQDGYLLKISPTGSTLVYGTYLGGLGTDTATGVTVDASGIATVVGQTSSQDFVGMPQALNGASDAYAIQLSADGSSMIHGRFFGGSGSENATAIASDNQGGFLLCGATTSTDFPVTAGVFQPSLLGQRNGWVVRLDSSFNTVYATYVGGTYIDGIQAIAADSSGKAYLAGVSFSSDLPVTSDGLQDVSSDATTDELANAGPAIQLIPVVSNREAYFGVLSSDGAQVVYGSFLSGERAGPDSTGEIYTIANAVAVAGNGAIYVGGATEAFDFPVTDGVLRNRLGGSGDGFLTKFESISLHSLSPSLLPTAEISSPFNYQLQAAGGTPPYSWEVAALQLPDGLSLNSNGLISGSPAQGQTWTAGGYQFTAKVTDAAGNVAYKSHFIQLDFQDALICTPNHCSIHEALVAPSNDPQFVYQVPNLARGVAPFSASLSGNVPPLFTLNADGTFSLIPSTAGDFQFAITIADATGRTDVINWDVNVASASSAPTSTGSGSTSGSGASGGTISVGTSGSKGGGGAVDYLSLTLLLVLVSNRMASRAPPRRHTTVC
jgi:Putative Ig domain